MWKTDKFTPPQPERSNGFQEDIHADPEDASSLRSSSPTLDDLRGQPGFGVVMAASDLGGGAQPPSIGQRMAVELDTLGRRERQVREMKELATHRVVDLTTDQLRRILEFMV